MKFSLDMIIANSEGALERVLGRLRQRNFALCEMAAGCTTDGKAMRARLMVESDRPIEPVIKQLAKLQDVRQIAVQTAEANVANVFVQNDANPGALELCVSL